MAVVEVVCLRMILIVMRLLPMTTMATTSANIDNDVFDNVNNDGGYDVDNNLFTTTMTVTFQCVP